MPGFTFLNGPAGGELGTKEESVPLQLGKINFNAGIIAGSHSINPILSLIIPGKDDGKVSVEHTKTDGMIDHLILPVTHTFMMRNAQAIQQTLYFLKNGYFYREIAPKDTK